MEREPWDRGELQETGIKSTKYSTPCRTSSLMLKAHVESVISGDIIVANDSISLVFSVGIRVM